LRNTKPQRRALVQSITKQFDNDKIDLHHMLYLADNLAYFPYVVQDEPLYIIHQIDVLISVTGTNLLTTFREGLTPLPGQEGAAQAAGGAVDLDMELAKAFNSAGNAVAGNIGEWGLFGGMLGRILEFHGCFAAPNPLEDDDDDDRDTIFERLPENTMELQSCITAAQGCMLLLILKQHLKELYGITDG
jgi:cohesin loading factor subunit SCC2